MQETMAANIKLYVARCFELYNWPMDDRLAILYARRSIRKYRPGNLPDDTITELCQAAMAAPSAHNRQPWQLLVITDQTAREQLSHAHPHAKFAADASAVFIVFGEPIGELIDHDLAAVTENLLVAAAGLGLGACWCGVTDERRPAIHGTTGIPAHMRIVSMVTVGYPAEQKEPRTQYNPDKVHWEKYGGWQQAF